jgi:hypothetical protein
VPWHSPRLRINPCHDACQIADDAFHARSLPPSMAARHPRPSKRERSPRPGPRPWKRHTTRYCAPSVKTTVNTTKYRIQDFTVDSVDGKSRFRLSSR